MWLRSGLLHHILEFFCKSIVFFHICIVFIISRFSDSEHIVPVFFQGLLRGLVLHNVAAVFVEVVKVGIAEPIVDDHRQIDLVFRGFRYSEIDWKFHGEVVLVKLAVVFVLPNAEMDSQRREPAFRVQILAVQFHVMVATSKQIGPKHLRLGRVGEKAGSVVGFV